jgi:hypothetical protein
MTQKPELTPHAPSTPRGCVSESVKDSTRVQDSTKRAPGKSAKCAMFLCTLTVGRSICRPSLRRMRASTRKRLYAVLRSVGHTVWHSSFKGYHSLHAALSSVSDLMMLIPNRA